LSRSTRQETLSAALFLSLSAREFCIFRRFHISRRLLVPRARVLLIFARRVIHYSPGATRPEIYRRNKARTLKKNVFARLFVLSRIATSALGIPPGPEQGSRENGTEEEELKSFARVIFKSARRRPLKSEKVFVYFSHLCACAIVWHSFAKTVFFKNLSHQHSWGQVCNRLILSIVAFL